MSTTKMCQNDPTVRCCLQDGDILPKIYAKELMTNKNFHFPACSKGKITAMVFGFDPSAKYHLSTWSEFCRNELFCCPEGSKECNSSLYTMIATKKGFWGRRSLRNRIKSDYRKETYDEFMTFNPDKNVVDDKKYQRTTRQMFSLTKSNSDIPRVLLLDQRGYIRFMYSGLMNENARNEAHKVYKILQQERLMHEQIDTMHTAILRQREPIRYSSPSKEQKITPASEEQMHEKIISEKEEAEQVNRHVPVEAKPTTPSETTTTHEVVESLVQPQKKESEEIKKASWEPAETEDPTVLKQRELELETMRKEALQNQKSLMQE